MTDDAAGQASIMSRLRRRTARVALGWVLTGAVLGAGITTMVDHRHTSTTTTTQLPGGRVGPGGISGLPSGADGGPPSGSFGGSGTAPGAGTGAAPGGASTTG